MSLVDIFGASSEVPGEPKLPFAELPPSICPRIGDIPTDLASKAAVAAEAGDRAAEAALRYKTARESMLDEVKGHLLPLKNAVESTSEAYKTAKQELMGDMEASSLSKVPMLDRDPIRIRTLKGRKRSVTRKWLKTEFGDQSGNSIWDRVPTGPDTRELVIPPPHDDQPSD